MAEVAQLQQAGTLADRINAEHEACLAATVAALGHALAAGDLLIKAKAAQRHGGWVAWLDANFEGTARTAQVYMRLARERELVEAAKAKSASHLSIAGAMQHLAPQAFGPPPVPGTVPLPPDQEAEERRKERAMQKLAERAAAALRTGNPSPPPDVNVTEATWGYAIQRAVSARQENIAASLDILACQLGVLAQHADPDKVARYLTDPAGAADQLAELREGAAWLQQVLEAAEQAQGQ